jgi:hypothetical protein
LIKRLQRQKNLFVTETAIEAPKVHEHDFAFEVFGQRHGFSLKVG